MGLTVTDVTNMCTCHRGVTNRSTCHRGVTNGSKCRRGLTNRCTCKGSKKRKARICGAVCTDQPRIIIPSMPNASIYTTLDTDRIRVEDVRKTSRCRMSESNELCAQISHASNTRRGQLSETTKLLTHIAAEMKTPRCGMPESIELYAQIGPASKTRKCTMSESTKLLTQIDAGRGQDPLEDACLERQRMR